MGRILGRERSRAAGCLIATCLLVSAALAGCVSAPAPPGAVGDPESVLDHYLCYFFDEVSFNPPAGIRIKDQFQSGGVALLERDFLCNPVKKTHSWREKPIKRPKAHLFCYRLVYRPLDAVVRVSNQFDPLFSFGQKLVVEQSWAVCLPTGKERLNGNPPGIPPSVDHYMCYKVRPDIEVEAKVNLADQFLKGPSVVKRAFLLCNPTEKRHSGKDSFVQNPDAHLVCYHVETPTFKPVRVVVTNQFEANVLITPRIHPPYLCVPSTKIVLSGPRLPPPPQEDLRQQQPIRR